MTIFYTVAPDYNLKCYRLFTKDDGMYSTDLGALTGEPAAVERQIAERLAARAVILGMTKGWTDIHWERR